MRHIEVVQIGSPIRREGSQRQTLVGLGLNKIGRSKWVPDTPAIRGMIARVSHLVRITHDPAAPKPLVAPIYDEAADVALMRELAFDKNKIGLEPYDDAALKVGKTPDFKLLDDGILCGYCEMKSPHDDIILKAPLMLYKLSYPHGRLLFPEYQFKVSKLLYGRCTRPICRPIIPHYIFL